MSEFWKRQKVLVTGGAGFFGTHLVRRLRALGCQNVFAPRSRDYDLRERAAIDRLLRDRPPTLLFHLAASVGGIGANLAKPGTFFYENAIMGIELLEQARRHSVPKVVIAGTVCSYPKHAPVPFRESDLWNGYPEETNAPYGIAKKALLVQAAAYRQEFGLRAICLLPANLYGPGDNFSLDTSHVIPALVRKFCVARERKLPVVTAWGSGRASREFLYVEDAAEAFALAAERYDGPDPVNIGTGKEITIRELAELVARLAGYRGSIEWDPAKPEGQPRRWLDVSRAKELFGFQARTTLEKGLRRTIAWYRSRLLKDHLSTPAAEG